MEIKLTETQIYDQIDLANAQINEGTSTAPSMSYEEGVKAALEWVLYGQGEPME